MHLVTGRFEPVGSSFQQVIPATFVCGSATVAQPSAAKDRTRISSFLTRVALHVASGMGADCDALRTAGRKRLSRLADMPYARVMSFPGKSLAWPALLRRHRLAA